MHLFFFLLFLLQSVFADVSVKNPVLHGRLENGMAYYVKENRIPEGKAFFQLVVKVGSVYEEEDEQGIAHFLEHLNFRGSEHLADGEQDRLLESIGCYDRNAMTGFEDTTYYLEIPIDKEENFDLGLIIMRDFAGFATLEERAIEKERHVVLDEMHQNFSSVDRRRFKEILIANFPESHLVNRFPIGTEEVISQVTPQTLRHFYKKWYRPDRMAIMVVGDFNGKEVEAKVKKLFGAIVNPEQQVDEPDLGLIFPQRDHQVVYLDPELDHVSLELIFSGPKVEHGSTPQKEKAKALRKGLVHLLATRLERAKEEGHFYDFSINHGFIQSVDHLFLEINFFERGAKEAMSAFFQEIERVKLLGFTSDELDQWKTDKRSRLEKDLANLDQMDHEMPIAHFVDHFFYQGELLSDREQLLLELEMVDSITLQELNDSIPHSLIAKPSVALLSTSSDGLKAQFEDEDLFALGKSPEGYLPFIPKKVHLDIQPTFSPGFIQATKKDDLTDVAEWTLSNGIKVLLKKTDLEKGKVLFSAVAKGGLAQFNPEEWPSAHFADWGLKGLKGLSTYEKKLFLEDKGIKAREEILFGSRELNYEVRSENIETVFQILHSVFTDPRFEQKSWDREISLTADLQQQGENKPAAEFSRFVKKITSGHHFSFQKIDLSKVSQEGAKKGYDALFGRPQDFTLLIVGDFDPQTVAEFAKKYIASLPVKERGEDSRLFLPPQGLKEKVAEALVLGHQTQAICHLTFPIDEESVFKKDHSLLSVDALVKLLKQRLWNILRAEHGKTYGVQVKVSTPFYPNLSFAQLQVEFTCLPEDREFMVDLVLQEIEKLQLDPPTAEEMSTLTTSFYQNLKEYKQFNWYWLGSLKFSELFGEDPVKVLDETKGERLLRAGNIQETAGILFSQPNYAVLYHLPEGGLCPSSFSQLYTDHHKTGSN